MPFETEESQEKEKHRQEFLRLFEEANKDNEDEELLPKSKRKERKIVSKNNKRR
jgi:hypothetical protein